MSRSQQADSLMLPLSRRMVKRVFMGFLFDKLENVYSCFSHVCFVLYSVPLGSHNYKGLCLKLTFKETIAYKLVVSE